MLSLRDLLRSQYPVFKVRRAAPLGAAQELTIRIRRPARGDNPCLRGSYTISAISALFSLRQIGCRVVFAQVIALQAIPTAYNS